MGTEYKGTNFTSKAIVIDGNVFRDCTFVTCQMIYRGGTLPTITQCNFQGCNWKLEEAAERTIVLMNVMYNGMGDGGKQLIDETVNSIRRPMAAMPVQPAAAAPAATEHAPKHAHAPKPAHAHAHAGGHKSKK